MIEYIILFLALDVLVILILPSRNHVRFTMCYRKIDLKWFSHFFYDAKKVGTKVHLPVFICELINYVIFLASATAILIVGIKGESLLALMQCCIGGTIPSILINIGFIIYYDLNSREKRTIGYKEPEEVDFLNQSKKDDSKDKPTSV